MNKLRAIERIDLYTSLSGTSSIPWLATSGVVSLSWAGFTADHLLCHVLASLSLYLSLSLSLLLESFYYTSRSHRLTRKFQMPFQIPYSLLPFLLLLFPSFFLTFEFPAWRFFPFSLSLFLFPLLSIRDDVEPQRFHGLCDFRLLDYSREIFVRSLDLDFDFHHFLSIRILFR